MGTYKESVESNTSFWEGPTTAGMSNPVLLYQLAPFAMSIGAPTQYAKRSRSSDKSKFDFEFRNAKFERIISSMRV